MTFGILQFLKPPAVIHQLSTGAGVNEDTGLSTEASAGWLVRLEKKDDPGLLGMS